MVVPVDGLVEPAVLSFESVLVPVAGFVPVVVSVFVESVVPVDGLVVSVTGLWSDGLSPVVGESVLESSVGKRVSHMKVFPGSSYHSVPAVFPIKT